MKEIEQYHKACNKLVKKFLKKQGIDDYYWVANEIGGMACFCEQYFFNMLDIALDLETKQPKGLILNWQLDSVEDYLLQGETRLDINYRAYTKGVRYEEKNN